MFSKATANFVHQIDPEGSLIHVSRVNDSHKLVPMALVVKRNRVWFWQKPKYQPTDFTLSDLLLGDEVLRPGVSETDFLTYTGTYGNQLSGSLDAVAGPVNVTLEGSGTSHLESCFGQLKKQELDVKKLLCDSRKRLVDMEHVLVQQLEKRAEVLAVVKERILTTTPCSIKQTNKEQCIFQGLLGGLGLLGLLSNSFEVCVKDKSNREVDSDVSVEIPSGTVIAYSIMDLEIKKDGRYAVCLRANMTGGFESDSLSWSSDLDLNAVDGGIQELPLSALLNGSEEMDLSPLAELPGSTRRVFFEKLQETLRDRPALTSLQFVLEELCNGETLASENGKPSDGQEESLGAILDQPDSGNGHCGASAQLNAAYLLVSAMEELPDETLNLLSRSSREDLKASDMLMCRLKESSKPLSADTLPALLQDDQRFQLAERLLGSAKVTLTRDGGCLLAEKESQAGVLPLVLCLSIRGLTVLCSGPE